ncbi:MAG: hypothetical protein ACI9CE_002450, partial [Flavobacterium sp.]
MKRGYKMVTFCQVSKYRILLYASKCLIYMVARGGIEPP